MLRSMPRIFLISMHNSIISCS